MNHIIKLLGVCFFILIALGSGTTLKAPPGKTFEEINSQSLRSMNGRLVLLGRHPELKEIEVYETESSIREMQNNKEICQRERGNKYSDCIIRLSKILPDANQGVKYYFLNGISISDDQVSQLLKDQRARIVKRNLDASIERNYALIERNKAKADAEEKARVQIEQDKVKRSRPVLNTD